MTTRWEQFYKDQIKDKRLRGMVQRELGNLALGIQIARLRRDERLSQTKLAALADMSAPKISAIERGPRNLTIATLIRIAHALGKNVEIRLVPRKSGIRRAQRRSFRAA